MNRIATAIWSRIKAALPKDWRTLPLLAVSMALLVLTWVLSNVGQPEGIVFLGLGLFFAAILSYFWYLFRPGAGWSDSRKFFSFLAANLIPFVLFGFLAPHVPAAAVVFFGLFAVVLAYTVWSQFIGKSIRDLMRDVLKTILVLLALLGIAVMLQGLGSLTGLDPLDVMGRDLAKIFGGS